MKRQDPATEYDEYGDEGARRQNARVGLIAGCAAFMAAAVLLVSVLTTPGLRREPELHRVDGTDGSGTDTEPSTHDTRAPAWETGPGRTPGTRAPETTPDDPFPDTDETEPAFALPDELEVNVPNGILYVVDNSFILPLDLSASGKTVQLPPGAEENFSLYISGKERPLNAVFRLQESWLDAPDRLHMEYAVSLPDGIPDGLGAYVRLQFSVWGAPTLTADLLMLHRAGTEGLFRLDKTAYPVGAEPARILFSSLVDDGSAGALMNDWMLVGTDEDGTSVTDPVTPRVSFDLYPPSGGSVFAGFMDIPQGKEYFVRTDGEGYWTVEGKLALTGLKPGKYRLIYRGTPWYGFDPNDWDGEPYPFFDFEIYDPAGGEPEPLRIEDVPRDVFALVTDDGRAVIPWHLDEAYGEGDPERLRSRFPMLRLDPGKGLSCLHGSVTGISLPNGTSGLTLSENPYPGSDSFFCPNPESLVFLPLGTWYVFITTDTGEYYGLYLVVGET